MRVAIQSVSVNTTSIPSVGRSVRRVYCGKMADWIWMPFEVMSGIGRWMGVLDGAQIVEGRAVLGVNSGHPIQNNGDSVV